MAINEIENQEEVRDVSIQQRNCRFMEESNLDVYPFYSYSACCVQCRKDAQLKTCKCAHHLMPNTGKYIYFLYYILNTKVLYNIFLLE